MIDEQYIALMNKLIDKNISPKEKAELDAYLADNEEARKFCTNLLATAEAMSRAADLEPPEQLAETVLRDLPPEPAIGHGWWRAIPEQLRDWLDFRPITALASGAAFGAAVVALLVASLGSFGGLDEHALIGTIIWGDGPSCVASSDEKSIACPGVTGKIAARPTESYVLIDLSLESEHEITVELEFLHADQSFLSVTQRGGGLTSVGTQEDKVTLHHVGKNAYTFVFSNEDDAVSAVDYRIVSDSLLDTDWLQTLNCE